MVRASPFHDVLSKSLTTSSRDETVSCSFWTTPFEFFTTVGRQPPTLSPPRSRYPDQLLIHKFTDAKIRELAAIAGVLHSTEWQVRRGPRRLVDKHHARFDLA